MKTNYNQSDVGRKVPWTYPLFKPLLTLLMVFALGFQLMATPSPGNQMTKDSICWDGTTTRTIGMNHGQPGMYHVLYHFKPDGTFYEFTLVVPTTTDPFNFVVNYGSNTGSQGLYVTYVYTKANYFALVASGYTIGAVTSLGTRQYGQVWIFDQPADRSLGYKGTVDQDYTISGTQAVYCSGSAGVTLASSESSNYTQYLAAGVMPVDSWVVKYDLYKDDVNQNDPKTGDGNNLTWSSLGAAPNTYTVKAIRGNCSEKLMTGSPIVNDQARVKNNNTGLCFLNIQDGINNTATINGHKLYCLLDEAYVEDLTVDKSVTIEPDPAQITANSWYICEVVGKIDIKANNVSILNFFGVGNVDLPFPTLTYAIKVFTSYSNYLIDNIRGINADVHGIWVEGGAGAGTISNSTIGTPSTGIFANGQLTGVLTISSNTIEGKGTGETGIQCNTDNAVIDGNTFNDNTPSVITTGDNVTIINNNFSNTTSGGVAINVTGTGVKIHYNNFSYSPPLTDLTAISSANPANNVVDAIHNWYGDPTGPTILPDNPCGLGSIVFGGAVNYSPWYFDATMVKLNGLPAIGLNDITDYSTITKTPLIIKATVTYPDTVSNYKSDVKNDCRITSTVNFPIGSRVADLKIYEGSSVIPYYTLPSPYDLPNDNKVYLSEIMGGYVFSLHSLNNNILHFEMTLDRFDAPWTSTITYDVVSYLNKKTNCNTVLNSDNFGLKFDNSALTITTTNPQQTEVCTGVKPLKFFANITYPEILNVDNTIKADAKITSAQVIPFGTEIKWSYNGSTPVSYLVDNLSGISSIYLSQIVAGNGNPAVQLPLQGNSGTDVWTFEIPSDAALETDHDLTIDAIAVLNTNEYVHNTANQTLTVHPLPTATLSIEDNYPTHICEGTKANFKVVLTGTGPWAITVQDSTSAGTHPEVINVAASPYYFQRTHVVNTSWRITNVDDAHCSNHGDGKVRILIGIVTTIGQPFYYNRIEPGNPGANPPVPPGYFDSKPITNLCEGNEDVYIPILVQNYEDVRAVSLSMTYDQNVLTYSEYLTKYRSVMSNLNVDGNTAGIIKAGGYEGNGSVIPGTDTLFVVRFTYNGGNSAMKFDTLNPVACEYLSYSSPIEPFCDTPNKFYYHNMGPDLTGHIRPKAAVSGSGNICAGTGGSFTVTLTGTQPWTFKYSDGNTEHTESNITSSPHTVNVNPTVTTTYTPTFVSDANGCTFWNADLTGSATITVKELPTASATAHKISCNGLTNGSIDLSVSGGTPTYSYSWTGPSFTSSLKDISSLAKGTYNVTVTDNAGCIATTSGTINEPDALDANLDHTNVTCNGANDGTITISNVSGGWGLYEYSFNGGLNWYSNLDTTGLAPGNYTVMLRDKDYPTCTKTLYSGKGPSYSVIITEPDALNATVSSTVITCNGAGNGTITVKDPVGGYLTWETSIDNFATTNEIFTGPTGGHTYGPLLPGTYYVKIRDKAHTGCSKLLSTIVFTDPVALDATVTSTVITCNNAANGTITIKDPTGGYGTWEASINDFTNSFDVTTGPAGGHEFSALGPATYTVKLRDKAHTSCVKSFTPIVLTNPGALDATLNSTNVTCYGANNGTITISNVSGGWGQYQYSFNGGTNWYSNLDTTGLAPGTFNVMLRDKDYPTCTKTLNATLSITEPDALNATVSSTVITCNGAGNGTITVKDPVGGYLTWETSIDNFATSNEIFTGPTGGHTYGPLLPGTYYVKIRDKAHTGCTKLLSTIVFTDPVALDATVTSTVINCNNAADGTITIKDPTGGYGTWEASINDFTTSFDVTTGLTGGHTFTALGPATYTVKLRDKAHTSCVKSFTPITLSNPDALAGTKSYTVITCNTLTDGTITVSAPSGGYGTYEASIDDFATAYTFSVANSYTFSALGPNTYTVKMRDAAHTGCTKNLGDVVLTDPAALNATVAHTVITCHNAGDGTITVSAPTGGYGTYEVSIDGFTSPGIQIYTGPTGGYTFTGLTPGSYTVKIRDKAKSTCVKDLETVTFTNPNDLDATVTSTVITCNNAANGTITVSNPTGGASTTYEITIDDFTTTHTLAPAGTYTYTQIGVTTLTVKIRDKEFTSCIKSFTPISFSNPDVLNTSSSTQDISCHGASDGSFAAYDPIGGWGTYEVSIDDFATAYTITTGGVANGHTFTNLAPGTYYGKIRDKAHTSCVVEYWSYTFTDPDALDATVTSTVINCNNAHDGTISVSYPLGGRGTWEATIDDFTNAYEIFTGPTGGHTFSGLYPGTYTVKLRDKANATCIKTFTPDITLTDPPALGGSELHDNITCYGDFTGTITITPSGGWGTYQYTKNGGTSWEDNGGSYTGLAAGTYNVAIRDKAHTGCVYTINGALQITQPVELSASVAKTEMSCHSTNDATITVSSAAGGFGTYEYSITSGTWQSSGSFTSVGPGTYDVYIRDAAHTGCTMFLETKVIVAPDAISVAGIVKYFNPTAVPAYTTLSDVTVKLFSGTTLVNSATVTASGPDKGKYSFSDVCPGTYTLTAERTLALDQNPVNATDAALVAQWSTDQTLIERVKFDAADVMGPQNTVNSIDARRIMLYFTSSGTNTWEVNPGTTWNFWTPATPVNNPSPGGDMSVTVSKAIGNITNEDLYGLFRGDFNSSWHPSAKSASENLHLNLTQTKSVEPGTEFELPIYVASNVNIKAMSMILNFPSDKLEITGAYLTGDPGTEVLYNLNGEELRLAWTSLDAVNIPANGRLMTLKLKLTQALAQDEFVQLSLVGNPLNELADANVNVIPNVELYSAKISSGSIGIGNATGATMEFANYPNPFNETTTFVYTTPVDGKVTINVYDMLGKQVNVFVNENMIAGDHKLVINSNTLKPGVYTATLILDSNGQVMKRTIKIIRNQ